jgi:hypothetical protein
MNGWSGYFSVRGGWPLFIIINGNKKKNSATRALSDVTVQ